MIRIQIKTGPRDKHVLTLSGTAPLSVLQAEIATRTGVSIPRQHLLGGGFPPTPIDLSDPNATLSSLSITQGQSLLLEDAFEESHTGMKEGMYIVFRSSTRTQISMCLSLCK